MHYGFLFVESRQLLSIGFDETAGEVHSACYDLLASEARIASFLAVAKGDIPQQSWFRLDRSHVMVRGLPVLLSWTGTMFEYMMPSLWMRDLSEHAHRAIRSSLPFASSVITCEHSLGDLGIGFRKVRSSRTIRLSGMGDPSFGSKIWRGRRTCNFPLFFFSCPLRASKGSIANLRRMAEMNWIGNYGFYEAADYTQGKQPELVRSWMAHHQGMCLLALANLLKTISCSIGSTDNPRIRATELLLHEKPLSERDIEGTLQPKQIAAN